MRCGADIGRSGGRRRLLACCAALPVAAATAFWSIPLAAQTTQQAQTLAEQAIRRLDLQTELIRGAEPATTTLTLPPELLWVAVIVGLCILLYAFRDLIPALRAERGGAWDDQDDALPGSRAQAPELALETADALAAQGRFVEAMHALLLQALAEIRRRLQEQFADSMTSREILRSRQVPDALRRPLRDVVARVEWTYFGGHPAAREDYLACRASFYALAQALRGGAAA